MLEAKEHQENCFLTLTYSDDQLPFGSSTLATLHPPHLRDWLKSFREAIRPLKIRFYAVGEYGDVSERPHYHVVLFGFPTCMHGRSRFGVGGRVDCCRVCDFVLASWGRGQVDLGSVTRQSCQYIAQYTVKKVRSGIDAEWLQGRYPEFSRQSKGIGKGICDEIADMMLRYGYDKSENDVPVAVYHSGKFWPLGGFLRREIRKRIGWDEKTPLAAKKAREEELSGMYDFARTVTAYCPQTRNLVFKNLLIDKFEGQMVKAEALEKLFVKGKRL